MPINSRNINAARILLEGYGVDSLSYFSLHEKKRFFFSSTGQSFLSYTIRWKIALVSADPIGPRKDISILLREFDYFIKGAKLTSCFLGVNETTLSSLVRQGHKKLHIGNEAVINLPTFKKSLLKKKVKRAENHVQSLGITCRIYKRKNIPTVYFSQLSDISKEWLAHKGGREKGYSMTLGRIPTAVDSDCEIVLGLKDQEVLGYLTFVPAYASKSLSLDTTRKKKNTPNGLTEFLLLQAIEFFKENGIDTISLNFATFYYANHSRHSPRALLKSVIYRFLSRWYKTNQLYNFNNKFLPNWQERYVTFQKGSYFPRYLLAIAKAEL